MNSIGIYHGDENWVLKGIGQDLAFAISKNFKEQLDVQTTDQVFKGIKLPTQYHLFVQQGQLNQNCNNDPSRVLPGTICLFTHLDVGNFRPKILSMCEKVIFNSSIQLSQAIANGYSPTNALLHPHAVDNDLHKIISLSDEKLQSIIQLFRRKGMPHAPRNTVGFCGRYWSKKTYLRRKNYSLIYDVINRLISSEIPVMVIGPGWNDYLEIKSDFLAVVETKYKYYPYYYNLMKVFSSLSIHEGGPLPLLESMSCGAYPVVTNTGFSFDVLPGNSYGRIISPFGSPAAIADIIRDSYGLENIDSELIRNRSSLFSFSSLANIIYKIVLNSGSS